MYVHTCTKLICIANTRHYCTYRGNRTCTHSGVAKFNFKKCRKAIKYIRLVYLLSNVSLNLVHSLRSIFKSCLHHFHASRVQIFYAKTCKLPILLKNKPHKNPKKLLTYTMAPFGTNQTTLNKGPETQLLAVLEIIPINTYITHTPTQSEFCS